VHKQEEKGFFKAKHSKRVFRLFNFGIVVA